MSLFNRYRVNINLILFGAFVLLLSGAAVCFAQGGQEVQGYVDSLDKAKQGMSLWETIKSGGFVMIVLCALSVVAMSISVYNFMNVKVATLAPKVFSEKVIGMLEKGREKEALALCASESNIIANVVKEGLEKKKRGVLFAKEAMENQVNKELSRLWQNISYLSDIASVAPLIGLLGTVLGMIQAFNVIAFQSAVVKPILLAGGVSKAMVTTAAGLVVAIPVMIFYSYFRGKVQEIAHIVETYCSDIIKIVEESGD